MNFVEGQTVGIDLGTSTTTVSQLDSQGEPAVLLNAAGEAFTPSVVILGDEGRVTVGPSGNWMNAADPERVIVGVKRQMGNAEYVKQVAGRALNAEFLSALVLMKVKQDAERSIGAIRNAVITVPYYFNDPCRRATMNAGQIAGLNVIDLLNEPTAATLAYAWTQGELGKAERQERERTILVYDLGGGTFDVTVVRYSNSHFRVIATDGDTFLGGLDWTRRLVNHVAELFKLTFRMDPREEGRARLALTEECDEAKRLLSQNVESVHEFQFRDKKLKWGITRGEFEKLTADLLQRTRDTTEFVMDAAEVDPQTLDDIVLIGGSTYMPMVHNMLFKLCGRKPSMVLDPQKAVAQGAAIHAAILEARHGGGRSKQSQAVLQRLASVTSTDVNSHSLGIEITEPGQPDKKRNHIMIPRNTALPTQKEQRFVTNLANPQGIKVRLLEGEARDAAACTFIGDFRITGLPPNLPVGSPVEVVYRYGENRSLEVRARELTGNNQAKVEIRWTEGAHSVSVDQSKQLMADYRVD